MRKTALFLLVASPLFLFAPAFADNPGPALSTISGLRAGETAVLRGFQFTPGSTLRIDLADPTGMISVYPVIADGEGNFTLEIPLAMPGTFRASAVDMGGNVATSTTIVAAEVVGQ